MFFSTKIKPFFAYCIYDWANSPFATVIITFIFAAYFEKAIVGDPEKASILWGWSISFSAFLIACLSPFIGRHIDKNLSYKFWLKTFTIISSIGAALFWFAYPVPESIFFVCILVIISNVAFELGGMVYNSLLPSFAKKEHIGSLSGKSWAFGYAGGIICLLIILFGFVQTDTPLFGIEKDKKYFKAANDRINKVKVIEESHLDTLENNKSKPRVPFGSLVELGIIKPGTSIFDQKKKVNAKIMVDGSIKHKESAGSIHKVAAKIMGTECFNGWTYWYCNIGGSIVPIDNLRQRFLNKNI